MTTAEAVKGGLFVRSALYCMLPGTAFLIEQFEDNGGGITEAGDLLSSGKSKHLDVRLHFIRDLV